MNTPTYEVKPAEELGWVGVGLAIGTLVGAIMGTLGVPEAITLATVGLISAASRPVIGLFLPDPTPVPPVPVNPPGTTGNR